MGVWVHRDSWLGAQIGASPETKYKRWRIVLTITSIALTLGHDSWGLPCSLWRQSQKPPCHQGAGTPWRLCGSSNNLLQRGCQAERKRCDSEIIFWAFVFGSRTEPIWAPSQLSLCTHTPTAHLTVNFPFPCIFFPKWPRIFCQHAIHQVIWPSPGTLHCTVNTFEELGEFLVVSEIARFRTYNQFRTSPSFESRSIQHTFETCVNSNRSKILSVIPLWFLKVRSTLHRDRVVARCTTRWQEIKSVGTSPSTVLRARPLCANRALSEKAQAYLQGALPRLICREHPATFGMQKIISPRSPPPPLPPPLSVWACLLWTIGVVHVSEPTLRLLFLPLVWQQAQLFRGSESKAQSLGPSREVARGPGWACSAATLIARCRKPALSQRTLATRIYAMIVNWPWARASLPTYVAVSSELLVLFQSLYLILRLE